LTGISKAFRRTNKDIVRVLKPGSEMLANVQQEFGMMLEGRREEGRKKIKMFCFYEELGYVGIGEVRVSNLLNLEEAC
jgi:protein SERAC1